ncbi:MAG: transposase [Pirellulales bacterium]|nr:transposase [Pirellulales bacterium]
MAQSLVKNLIHLVYSTKHRRLWIPDDIREQLFAYQCGIYKNWDSPAFVIGGTEDHIHALFSLSKNYPLKKIVEEVKKSSSKWMKTHDGTRNSDFQWQAGYAGFSVSQSYLEEVKKYIELQADHHHRMTFEDELRALFRRHGMEIDEQYLWD